VANTRDLDGQSDKHNSFDFALWKKASPEHIMRWPSPWSDGFPGWHMECSAMSCKYLGEQFDIHGGGMDLMFPHHECEIAQATAALGKDSARYWVHNNMITIDGQKMGKSYGNFITMEELFNGTHPKLEQAYSPMTIRFFILQAHYRSTLDFSNAALQAAEKGFDRLMKGVETLGKLKASAATSEGISVAELEKRCAEAMNDDLNSPMVISALFDYVRVINQVAEGQAAISEADLQELRRIYNLYVFDILGLRNEKQESAAGGGDMLAKVVDMILAVRQDAKANKDWATSDKIRNELTAIGIRVKDRKDGVDWEIE
jgi:cysteinyl-tRNA synthetase